MRRRLALAAAALALALAGCGGDGDGDGAATTPTTTDEIETPAPTPPPAGATGGLPPEFVECVADQGFEITSASDIHSAPPQVLQACFGALHGGGATP